MNRPCKFSVIGKFLILILLVATPAHSKPWRNFEPISASDISWKGVVGICGGDRTRLFSLTGRGGLSIGGRNGDAYDFMLLIGERW